MQLALTTEMFRKVIAVSTEIRLCVSGVNQQDCLIFSERKVEERLLVM